jgi:glucose-6-phosphate 1-dehydrogenase
MTDETFREKIKNFLPENSASTIDDFLKRCYYCQGNYSEIQDYAKMGNLIQQLEEGNLSSKMYYLAIPPFLFLTVSDALAHSNLIHAQEEKGIWTRVVVEKPFGKDRESSDELTAGLQKVFREEQVYRIDHYLAKEVIQNLMVIRFANLILEPLWNRQYIQNVRISWMEDIGIEGRGGYFDEYGIIRDVMQNHLLQILALVAMEQPIQLKAGYIRDEKVKVLRCIPPVSLSQLVVGQYGPGVMQCKKCEVKNGYRDEEGVPKDSITPTYAAVALFVKNRRWDGVHF